MIVFIHFVYNLIVFILSVILELAHCLVDLSRYVKNAVLTIYVIETVLHLTWTPAL